MQGQVGLDGPDEEAWPLVKVFDLVALVLTGVVVIRAIGGLLSATGVVSFNSAAPSGSGLVVRQPPIPTYLRLQYGTSWADIFSGLLLLAALALIVLPPIVWEMPPAGRWTSAAPRLVIAVAVVAFLASLASVTGTVDLIWHSAQFGGGAALAEDVAEAVAPAVLAALCAVLAWFSLPFLGSAPPRR